MLLEILSIFDKYKKMDFSSFFSLLVVKKRKTSPPAEVCHNFDTTLCYGLNTKSKRRRRYDPCTGKTGLPQPQQAAARPRRACCGHCGGGNLRGHTGRAANQSGACPQGSRGSLRHREHRGNEAGCLGPGRKDRDKNCGGHRPGPRRRQPKYRGRGCRQRGQRPARSGHHAENCTARL